MKMKLLAVVDSLLGWHIYSTLCLNVSTTQHDFFSRVLTYGTVIGIGKYLPALLNFFERQVDNII